MGKYEPEKTPHSDTFHAVLIFCHFFKLLHMKNVSKMFFILMLSKDVVENVTLKQA